MAESCAGGRIKAYSISSIRAKEFQRVHKQKGTVVVIENVD
jgi:hypothetical protein